MAHAALEAPPDQAPAGSTVLVFSDEDGDHCRYDTAALLSNLTDDESAVIAAHFPDAATSWTTTTDLYCASEELEELGHEELAGVVGQFIHAEQIFGCICETEAFEEFKATVAAAAKAIEARFPHVTWWTPDHVHAHGLDVDMLLTDLGRSDTCTDAVTFTIDANGDVTVTDETRRLEAQAFTTPEEGALVQHLDACDIPAVGEGRQLEWASVEEWLELPETERTLVAHLYFHDVAVAGIGANKATGTPRRARDLAMDQLRQNARILVALPEPVRVTLVDLLPNAEGTLEDLVDAVMAAYS